MYDDARWGDARERDGGGVDRDVGGRGASDNERQRTADPRDVFRRDLDLPRGPDRERVRHRNRTYRLNDEDVRALSTIGAFRVVDANDLREQTRTADPEREKPGDSVDHLRESGLVETRSIDGGDRVAVALTRDGRDLLEHARDGMDRDHRQTFHAGIRKPRELTHDVDVYRAYRRASSRVREDEGQVRCVVLDYEMKREYQQFLQEPNRGNEASDGRPRRDEHEIRHWAEQHDLPYFDDQVHFPDCRIEYEDRYGREQHHDIEVVTPHYRGGHAAATARTGFQCYRGAGLSGRNGGAGGRRGARGGLAEELLS